MATILENADKAISDFNSIKTAITEKGVDVADTDGTNSYGGKVRQVYDKGKADILSEFWDKWQDYGNRTDYQHGFAGWSADMTDFLRPKYDIRPKYAYMMFSSNQALTDLPAWCAECGIELDFGNCTNISYFMYYSNIKHVGIINTTSANNLNTVFAGGSTIVTIDKIILLESGQQMFSTPSFENENLENITFEGTIGNNIWFSACTKLTTASLLSILTALSKDSTLATGKTITLATAHQAKIEADADCAAQLNAAIAAGWTVAYV